MKVEAWNEDGESVLNEKGELVCTAIFPSMPLYFLNDIDGKIYHKTYFDVYPNVWLHGDYIEITDRGSLKMFGRSDATLNPGGIRIGTAEIYRVVEELDEITDSIAVGLTKNNDTAIVLFVVTSQDITLDENLENKIKAAISRNLTPRHVPSYIRQISEVPVTLNGKKMEIGVSNIINGRNLPDTSIMANPQSQNQFKGMEFK